METRRFLICWSSIRSPCLMSSWTGISSYLNAWGAVPLQANPGTPTPHAAPPGRRRGVFSDQRRQSTPPSHAANNRAWLRGVPSFQAKDLNPSSKLTNAEKEKTPVPPGDGGCGDAWILPQTYAQQKGHKDLESHILLDLCLLPDLSSAHTKASAQDRTVIFRVSVAPPVRAEESMTLGRQSPHASGLTATPFDGRNRDWKRY